MAHVVRTAAEAAEVATVEEAATSEDVGSKSTDHQPVPTTGSLLKICPLKSHGRFVTFCFFILGCAVSQNFNVLKIFIKDC